MVTKQTGVENRQILDEVEKRAFELIDRYHACAQCSLMAIQEVCGYQDELLTKASVGLSGGVGGMRSVCGALTGSVLGLGLKYGRDVSFVGKTEEEAVAMEEAAMEPAMKLAKWFEREYGTINCHDIRQSHMGTDLNSKIEWQKEWLDELGMHERCAGIVAKTARRAAAMLQNPDLGITEQV